MQKKIRRKRQTFAQTKVLGGNKMFGDIGTEFKTVALGRTTQYGKEERPIKHELTELGIMNRHLEPWNIECLVSFLRFQSSALHTLPRTPRC